MKILQQLKYGDADADYIYANRVCKDFEVKNLGKYYDLYVNGDTLLQTDVFENVRKVYQNLSF